jgi:ATP-binding cassette subfamily B protein
MVLMHPHPASKAESKSWRERLAALRNVPPLLRMVWETSPALAVTGLLLRLVWAILPVTMLWVSKLIIDRVVNAVSGKNGNLSEIWVLLGVEFGLVLLTDLLMRGVNLSDSLLGDRFTNYISLRLMEHAARLDLAHFEDPTFYDKLERARRQTSARLGMLGQISGLLQAMITLLSVSVAVVSFSWLFLALLLLAMLPVFWSETRFAMLSYSLLYRWTPERRELDYLRMLGTSNQSAKEVKIFGLGNFLTERSRVLFERYFKENKQLSIRKASTGALLNLLPTAGYFAAYALILARTLRGELSVGDLTFLTGAFLRSRTSMEAIFNNLSSVSEQALYIQDLFDFFETKPTIQSLPTALPAPRPIRSGFEFRNVSFAYPDSQKLVLDNISFRLDPNRKIALIGENGAGKTTLVKLLARLYDPTAGVILLDGIDLREYSVEDLRKEIGVIFQDYMRYDMKAKENIGVGRIEEILNDERIEDSAQKSLADTVVFQLTHGFEQMLGRRFEGGAELSVGQWQKVALARAYMRDAQVLILDEPTASLDARSEFEVFRRFSDLTQGKMAVLISHRFSTVRMADQILVLENGRIKEQGSHEQLLALGGRYAELFELQAAGYR